MAAARQKEMNVSMAVVATITRGTVIGRERGIADCVVDLVSGVR